MTSASTILARLPHLTVGELRDLHREVFGQPTASRHKTWLVRRIAWQVQAREQGGLTEQVLAKAAAIAAGQQVRERRPASATPAAGPTKLLALPASRDPGLAPGQVLTRAWRGQDIQVMIERVRDKVAATKRMGKWCGGVPVLGYDVAPGGRKLVVNEAEAERVRAIFAIYQEQRSLTATVQELDRRGWRNKAWTSGSGQARGGAHFSISTVARLLGSILYTGRVRYRGEIFPGDHPAIIDQATWDAVRALMAIQQRTGGAERRIRHHALLRGILRCAPCGCGMTYTYTQRGAKRYAYYTCQRARAHGAASCPMPNIPVGEVERLVVDELAAICSDPHLATQVIEALHQEQAAAVNALRDRLRGAERLATDAASAWPWPAASRAGRWSRQS